MKVEKVFRYIVLVFGLLILILGLLRINPFLTFMSALYMVLMSKVLDIEGNEYSEFSLKTLKRDLFVWCFFPMILGAIGTTPVIDEYFFFIFQDLAYMTLAAIFAFMIMIVLNYYTDLRSNRKMVIFFVVIFTIGAGTVTGILRYYSDIYLGTIYLGGNTYLMAYLTMVTILGISIGMNIEDYICAYEFFPLKNIGSGFKKKKSFKEHRAEFMEFLNLLFSKYNSSILMIGARILQVGIIVTIIYGLYTERWMILAWSIFSLIFAISPDIFRRNTDKKAPSIIYFWLAFVTFVFAFGRPMGFYSRFDMWAGVTHFLTGTLVGVLVFSYLVYLNWISKELYIPPYLIISIVLISIFPIGVIWEISEFYVDIIFDKSIQAGIEDTVSDLLCNFGGTLASVFMILSLKLRWTYE